MNDSHSEAVRYALRLAREHGFRRIRVEHEGWGFRATLQDAGLSQEAPQFESEPAQHPLTMHDETSPSPVTASFVGYYREVEKPLATGRSVQSGEVIAVIEALGLANEVISGAEGVVDEVLVRPGQAVEYGQILATVVKPT